MSVACFHTQAYFPSEAHCDLLGWVYMDSLGLTANVQLVIRGTVMAKKESVRRRCFSSLHGGFGHWPMVHCHYFAWYSFKKGKIKYLM